MKNLFLIAFAFVVFAGAGGYALVKMKRSHLAPQGDMAKKALEAAENGEDGWKWYQSDRLPYRISLPPDTQIEARSLLAGGQQEFAAFRLDAHLKFPQSILADFGQKEKGSFLFVALRASKVSNSDDVSFRERVARGNITGGEYSKPPEISRKEIMVNGEPAYYAEVPVALPEFHSEPIFDYTYSFLHDGYLYQISGIRTPAHPALALAAHPYFPYLKAAESVAEKIIGSFQFTE